MSFLFSLYRYATANIGDIPGFVSDRNPQPQEITSESKREENVETSAAVLLERRNSGSAACTT